MSVKEVIRLDQLNGAGKEGWELVNVNPLGQSFLLYTFKRPAGAAPAAKVQEPAANVNTAGQSRAKTQKTKPGSLRDIQVEAQKQIPEPQETQPTEEQPGINLQDILNSILGGGNKF